MLNDVLITDGTGMTGVVNKFHILGLKVPENLKDFITIPARKTYRVHTHGAPF
jgi:hypothetical protein